MQLELSSPPRPRLAFRVGVVGHRPNRLGAADLARLGEVLREVLETVRDEVEKVAASFPDVFAQTPPMLRAVSPLAEGTDRIFAQQAMAVGYELCCVMPFPKEEYERDFLPDVALEADSMARFHRILESATGQKKLTVLQLDGCREDSGRAYGTGGRVVLSLCDLLVAVYDGKDERDNSGGTAGTLREASIAGIPVLQVDAHAPHHWRLGQSAMNDTGPLRETVRAALVPPALDRGAYASPIIQATSLDGYFREKPAGRKLAVVWRVFRDMVGDGRFRMSAFKEKAFEEAAESMWPRDRRSPAGAMVDKLRPFHAFPDGLANRYGDRYRSAYLLCYSLAAAAVAMALLPVAMGPGRWEWMCGTLELICIGGLLGIFLAARRGHWHERWLDYRLAGELIRHLRIVAPVCGKPPFPRMAEHHATYGQPAATWMNWHLLAVSRALEMGNVTFDRVYLSGCLEDLRALLDEQRKFHEATAARCERIERRLHGGILASLALTVIACVMHLAHLWLPGGLLTFLCGSFPAMGGALAAINNQGEFRRTAKRSHAMAGAIGRCVHNIDQTSKCMDVPRSQDRAFLPEVQDISRQAANLLLHEVLEWRVLFLDRPPEVGP